MENAMVLDKSEGGGVSWLLFFSVLKGRILVPVEYWLASHQFLRLFEMDKLDKLLSTAAKAVPPKIVKYIFALIMFPSRIIKVASRKPLVRRYRNLVNYMKDAFLFQVRWFQN